MTAITLATDSMNQVIRRQLGLSLSEAGCCKAPWSVCRSARWWTRC